MGPPPPPPPYAQLLLHECTLFDTASVKIQATVRGFTARCRVARLKAGIREAEEHKAALRIQANARGKLAKQRAAAAREEALAKKVYLLVLYIDVVCVCRMCACRP